jgi:Protein of unknown function (DUF2384)
MPRTKTTPAPALVAAGSADKQTPQKVGAENRAPTSAAPMRTLTSRAFWQAVDRLQIADADALGLIDYPGKLSASGKRPRFHLTTRQTKIAAYLPEIEVALAAAGQTTAWLCRPIRSAPFAGRTPVKLMAEQPGEGAAVVLQFLNRSALRKSLR